MSVQEALEWLAEADNGSELLQILDQVEVPASTN
jgi:hypothetical protein